MRDPRGARPTYLDAEIERLRQAARPYWRGVRTPEAREAHRRYSLAVANLREANRPITREYDEHGFTIYRVRT